MNRREQDKALKTLEDVGRMFAELEPIAKTLFVRNRFSTGQRKHIRGELGEMEGTTAPHYGDSTGDDACWDEIRDTTGKAIEQIADKLNQILSSGVWLLKLANKSDVVVRAELNIPDCMACGEPCPGRIIGGFDEKCYKRWQRVGRPDRYAFIATVRGEAVSDDDQPSD